MRDLKAYTIVISSGIAGQWDSRMNVMAYTKRDAITAAREEMINLGACLRSELRHYTFTVAD